MSTKNHGCAPKRAHFASKVAGQYSALREGSGCWHVVLLSIALVSCQASLPDAEPTPLASGERAENLPIELFSWWTRVGESDALAALVRVHAERHPNDDVTNASAQLSGLARKTLGERLRRGEPPDTFQANAGSDLLRWVLVNGLDDRESELSPVNYLLAQAHLSSAVFPQVLLDHITYDGKLYGIPANLHRINQVFYSKRLFREHEIEVPRSFDELIAAGKKLQAAKIPLLALGSKEPWTLGLLALECVLIGEAGSAFYTDYFTGQLQPTDPRLERALLKTLALAQYANDDYAALSWIQALTLVGQGRAAMTVMGDWARVAFEAQGIQVGGDVGEFPFPGTEDVLVYTSDIFTLPRHARNRPGAERLLQTLMSVEGQSAIQASRLGLAARLDVDPVRLTPALQEERQLLVAGKVALAQSGLVPARFSADINQALQEMIVQHDVEPVLQTVVSRYTLLR